MSLVELYYSDSCTDCHHIRTMLLRMLPKGVTFKEVNAFEGEGAVRAKQLGILSVPTVVLDGEVMLIGRVDADDIRGVLDSITL